MEEHLALHAVLIPSVLAALACAASRFLPMVRRFTPILVPLAIGAVAIRAGVVQEGSSILSTWPPATKWITAIACIAAVAVAGGALGLFAVRDDDRGPLGPALLGGLLTAATVMFLLEVPGESTRWVIARAAIAAGLLSAFLATGKVRGPGIFLSLAFPAAALAGMSLLSGSAKLAVTAGAIAFVCGLLGLMAIPLRITLGAGGIATMVVGITSLAAQGRAYDYDSFPSWLWLVVVLAPLTGAIADVALVRLLPGAMRLALRVGPPLLVSGVVLLIAAWRAGAFGAADASEAYGP